MVIDEGNLSRFFTPFSILAVTLVSLSVALLGIISNVIIIIIFYNVYGVKRFQSILWLNLSCCQITQCLVMIYDAVGAHVLYFSNSEFSCSARHFLPISLDQVFLGSYLVLLTERMAIVHSSTFHSLIPKLYSLMIIYGWSFGLTFLLLVHNDVLQYHTPLQCLSPYLTNIPQESVTLTLYFMTALVILISLVSVLMTVPQAASKVEKLRQEIEGKGVSVTLFIGSFLVLLSAPRHVVSIFYWVDSIDILAFQVFSKLSSMLLRLNVLLPFIALMMRLEFRSGVQALITFKSLDPTRKKIAGQENYISTVQKLVQIERKKIAERRRTTSYNGRKSSLHAGSPEVKPKGVSVTELKPRNEISLVSEEEMSKISQATSFV